MSISLGFLSLFVGPLRSAHFKAMKCKPTWLLWAIVYFSDVVAMPLSPTLTWAFSLPPARKAMCSWAPLYIAPTVTSSWPLPFFSIESRRAVSIQVGIVLSALEISLPR